MRLRRRFAECLPEFEFAKRPQPMSMVGFPLLLIPFAIYNIIAFLMPSVSFAEPLVRLTLVSGTEWPITLSDVLLTIGILLLLLEVMKAARPGGKYLTDHLLSFLVFGGSAAEFVMWPKFGTSTYFLLVLLAMVDFFSGIALRSRRASVTQPASRTAVARRAAKEPDAPRAEPHVEPAPAPAPPPAAAPEPAPQTPSAASVAESVLKDRPEPKAARANACFRERTEKRAGWHAARALATGPVSGLAAGKRHPCLARDAEALSRFLRNHFLHNHSGEVSRPEACPCRARQTCSIGGERIRWRRPAMQAGLRDLFDGCDQLRHEGRIGPQPPRRLGALCLLFQRHERHAGGLGVGGGARRLGVGDAVFCRLLRLASC
jgi:hypothetical protein